MSNAFDKMPWKRPELIAWSIVGMNHYRIGVGSRSLFVAMTCDGYCIQAEGPDEARVFENLAQQARKLTGTLDKIAELRRADDPC